jgi:molybdopterin-guanine dinucleotide biosynthesis protein A
MSVTGIVLCGGRSTRMGADKASLPFGGVTLVEHVAGVVSQCVDRVIVVARPDQSVAAHLEVVRDDLENLGPLAAIARGLKASTSELNFITACDMPLLRPAVIARLLSLAADFDVCVPVDGDHAMVLCAVYRHSLGPVADALVASGQLRLRSLVEGAKTKRVDTAAFRDIDPNLDSFVSCNTPDEYQKMKRSSPIT